MVVLPPVYFHIDPPVFLLLLVKVVLTGHVFRPCSIFKICPSWTEFLDETIIIYYPGADFCDIIPLPRSVFFLSTVLLPFLSDTVLAWAPFIHKTAPLSSLVHTFHKHTIFSLFLSVDPRPFMASLFSAFMLGSYFPTR